MKRYILSGAQALTHTPNHPERTARVWRGRFGCRSGAGADGMTGGRACRSI